MNEWLSIQGELIVFVLIAVVVIQSILLLVIFSKVKTLRKKYVAFMDSTGVEHLEDVLTTMNSVQKRQQEDNDHLREKVNQIEAQLPLMTSKVAIHRFNAFSETGSDLSFSLALLNEHKDGVVVTGIHNRESSYVYAKPIEKGKSKYNLTPEEQKVINEAK